MNSLRNLMNPLPLNRFIVYAIVYDNFFRHCSQLQYFFKQSSASGSLYSLFSQKIPLGTVGYVPVHTVVRPQIVDDDKNLVCFRVPLQQFQIFILMSFTHFLDLRDAEGLYISTRDLPDATRGKLVVIEASRVLYECIFVYGVLRVITQRCVRARSLTRLGRLRRFLSISECP